MVDKAKWEAWAAATRHSPELAVEHAKLDFALALERLMALQGVNQAELSRRMGTSAAAVSVAMRGDANLTIERMVRFAAALDSVVHVHLAPRGENARCACTAQATTSVPFAVTASAR